MKAVKLSNVGNGLCMSLHENSASTAIIDCGGDDAKLAYDALAHHGSPKDLILSHFHQDHYNGFLYAAQSGKPIPPIDRVWYPRMPQFGTAKLFETAHMCLFFRFSFKHFGIDEYDVLGTIARITSKFPLVHRVSQGDTISIGNHNFEVLWPPRKLILKRTLNSINSAISNFDEALKNDPELKRIHDLVVEVENDNTQLDVYKLESRFVAGDRVRPRIALNDLQRSNQIPPVTRDANKSYRNAANRLSLVFHDTDELLFMGDLERNEIRTVMKKMISINTQYGIMVPPHHGTHWPRNMNNPLCSIALSSCGRKLISNYSTNLQNVARLSLSTFTTGDVVVYYDNGTFAIDTF